MSLLGALLGSLAALAAGNRLGRRTELLMASGLYGGWGCRQAVCSRCAAGVQQVCRMAQEALRTGVGGIGPMLLQVGVAMAARLMVG
jgi:hypothetical protein